MRNNSQRDRRERERSRDKNKRQYHRAYRSEKMKENYKWKDHKERDPKKQHSQFNPKTSNQQDINRTEICPFLVKVYYAINIVNSLDSLPADRQIQLYLWMNTSLKQIAELLRAHIPSIRTKQRFVFNRVYEEEGELGKKEMGVVMVHKKSEKGEEKTLLQNKFCIGDMIDVSINYK